MAANVFNLEFEKPILELERQITSLKKMASDRRLDVEGEIVPLEAKLADLPNSALAAVVIAAAVSLADVSYVRRLWPVRRSAVVLS